MIPLTRELSGDIVGDSIGTGITLETASADETQSLEDIRGWGSTVDRNNGEKKKKKSQTETMKCSHHEKTKRENHAESKKKIGLFSYLCHLIFILLPSSLSLSLSWKREKRIVKSILTIQRVDIVPSIRATRFSDVENESMDLSDSCRRHPYDHHFASGCRVGEQVGASD